jgi:hypothetical protein
MKSYARTSIAFLAGVIAWYVESNAAELDMQVCVYKKKIVINVVLYFGSSVQSTAVY